MRRKSRLRLLVAISLVLVAALAGLVGQVEASDGMRGDHCRVTADEVIVDDFYFFCRIVEIDGTIDGDVLGVASEVVISDTAIITGDLWIGGGKVTVAGQMGDDIHFAGLNLAVQPAARFTHDRIDVVSLALNTAIEREATLPGDLLVYGYQAQVSGTVGGDIDFLGEALTINGRVAGRVDATIGDARRNNELPGLPLYDVSFRNPGLRIGPEAYIGGDLAYETTTSANIPLGVVQGDIDFTQTLNQPDITKAEQPDVVARILVNYFTDALRDVLTLMLVGVLLLRVLPNTIRQPAVHVRRRTIPAVGWGLVTFMLAFPLAIVLIIIGALVVVGLVLIQLDNLSLMVGLGILIFDAGLIVGFTFLLFFMGRVVISFVAGQLIYRHVLRSIEQGTLRRWIITLAMGATVYALVTNVPIPGLGLVIELVTALAGIGAVVLYARNALEQMNLFTPQAAPVEALPAEQIEAAPPPMPVEPEKPLGMDNLPEGFSGFKDW
jgi:hypothetical protein